MSQQKRIQKEQSIVGEISIEQGEENPILQNLEPGVEVVWERIEGKEESVPEYDPDHSDCLAAFDYLDYFASSLQNSHFKQFLAVTGKRE